MQERTIWTIKEPVESSVSRNKMKLKTKAAAPPRQKNPALAFSLSLLVWGGGQIYNRQWKVGVLLILLMVNFYTDLAIVAMYQVYNLSPFITDYVSSFALIVSCAALYLLGIIFWFINALDAYYTVAKTRKDRFQGTEIPFLPPLCSLFIPGWGQFLNGQAKKGSLFLVLTMAGLSAFPYLLLFPRLWPTLETASQRLFLEWALVIALLLSPFILLAWLLSIYDSIKVCLDDIKKEPLRKRFRYAINRIRMQGFVHGLIPQAKLTLVLSLLLTLTLTFSFFFFPKQYYATYFQHVQTRLSKQEMMLIPHLTNRFLKVPYPEEKDPEIKPDGSRINI